MFSPPLINYVLKAALRDRLYLSIMVIVAIGASLAVFMGSSAVIEADQFALVFAAGGLRFAGVAGLVLFTVFHMRRAFDAREVEFLLSRPVSRVSFLLSHAAALSLLAAVVAGVVIAGVVIVAPHKVGEGLVLWSLSLIVEFIIIVNAALFFSMVLSSATAGAMAVFGLYVLARLMGELLGISETGLRIPGYDILVGVMKTISLAVPRLDLMAQTSWLVYGPGDIGAAFILMQGAVYTALLALAGLVDLTRRQF